MKPIPLGPFLGVNTRRDEKALHVDKTGDFLRAAVNVDLTPQGAIKPRPGFEQVIAGTTAHSLYGDGDEPACYVDGTTLYRLRPGPAGLDRESLRSDLIPGMQLSYGRMGETLFYSNGIQKGYLTATEQGSGWGELPSFTNPLTAAYTWREMPAGGIVRVLFGRLLVARADRLYWSLPWNPAVRQGGRSYLTPSPGENIVLVAPVEDAGCFLATERETFWVAGDVASAAGQTKVLPYGAVARTDAASRDDRTVYWRSQSGVVRGKGDGSVQNLQEAAVGVDPAASGATLLREYDGMRKVVSSASNAGESRVSARSYMEAEIIRKGETP